VLRRAALLALAGAAAGLALAAALSTLLRGFLIGLQPIDPLAFGVALGVLVGVMFLSSWAPARRAATTDPIASLRAD
jgi:ABC-type antimicrobial peptide transport system permease subunit